MDWPSRELSQRLAEWGLCSPQDLQRCRSIVKQFVRELPAFDSVWIDALLQHHILTPWQARVLDSTNPEHLRIGNHVLIDALEENAWRCVYRARPLAGGDPCLLTVHALHPEDRVAVLEAIDATISQLSGLTAPGINCPRRAEVGDRCLIVESPDAHGVSLRELLVRRGRFPAAVVMAIAKQLTALLAALEERHVPHGDLRARNILLTPAGDIQLLHSGNLTAIMPSFQFQREVPLDVCDAIAPELSRGGAACTAASDQYALGCLLWQLLAGRPVFPTGDAHSKVSSHSTKAVPSIRDLAPLTPVPFAAVLTRLTQPDPQHRFSSFRELSRVLSAATAADARTLRRFLRSFETEAPAQTAREITDPPRQWPTAVAAVLLGAATIWLFASQPVSLGRQLAGAKSSGSPTAPGQLPANEQVRPMPERTGGPSDITQTAGTLPAADTLRPLPMPDEQGIVWLKPGTPYQARAVTFRGELVIKAADGAQGLIAVQGNGWDVAGETVRLENVDLRLAAPLRVQCRNLLFQHSAVSAIPESAAMLTWQPIDTAAVDPGAVLATDSVFQGLGVVCRSRPSQIRFTNCLKVGPGALLQLTAQGRAHQRTHVHVVQCTVRDSGPVLIWEPGSRAAGQVVKLVTKACVFAPGADSSVLALSGSLPPAEWQQSVAIEGLESLVQTGTRLIDLQPAPGKPKGQIDSAKLDVDGLLTATVEFFGPAGADPQTSGLKTTDAIFSVDNPPGINASKVAIPSSRMDADRAVLRSAR